MKEFKGYKGFRAEERFLFKTSWEVKLIGNKKQGDKHLALFHDEEALNIFTEALENKGIKNLTNVNLFS